MPHPTIPYVSPSMTAQESLAAAESFLQRVSTRRSVREFSDRPIADGILEACLRAAGSAPSGANKQPWRFIVVRDPELKRRIREAAEKEEHDNYAWRMSASWKRDLEPLGTDENKAFLETVPALIVVMALTHGDQGPEALHYYVQESVGLACGVLLTALHHAGLAALTHTPSPMTFLKTVLERPAHERPFLLIPVGYPADDCRVPDIHRKPLEDIAVWR